MDIRYQVVALDAADLEASSSFWAGVFDGTVDRDDDWHMVIDRDGTPRIGIQAPHRHRLTQVRPGRCAAGPAQGRGVGPVPERFPRAIPRGK